MGSADRVGIEVILQDVRILFLCPPAHGIAHIGEGLVAVQAHYLDFPVVNEEALRCAGYCAETRSHMVPVQHASARFKGYIHRVEVRVVRIPQNRGRDALWL